MKGNATFPSGGAGVVAYNTEDGTVSDVKFEGLLQGHDYLAGLVSKNEGTIQRSKFGGELRCISESVDDECQYFAGLVSDNYGSLLTTKMSGSLTDTAPNLSSYFASIAHTNRSGALIQDVFVSMDSKFSLLGTNPSYFTNNNESSGTLRRVINNGKLIFGNTSVGTPATNWPVSHLPFGVSAGSQGNFVDVYRRGTSGKILAEYAAYSCATDIVTLTGWDGGAIAAGGWGTYLNTNYNGFADGDKKLVLELESSSGYNSHRILQVLNFAGPENFAVAAGECADADAGSATLYWTDDIPVDTTDGFTPIAGVITPPYSSLKATYGATWAPLIWDESGPDQVKKISYYMYYLGAISTASTPATWELWEDEISLFSIDPDENDD